MEGPQYRRPESVRDINDLLVNGFYKTSTGRSPAASIPSTPAASTYNATSFLNAHDPEPRRNRSRSRSRAGPRRPAPPKPTCEDEVVALAREFSFTGILTSDDEPPMRGIIEQHPIVLEADVTAIEAARLHAEPRKVEEDHDHGQRRFVLIPKSDTHTPNRADGFETSKGSRDIGKEAERTSRGKQGHDRREDKMPSVLVQPTERPKQHRQESERREEQRSYISTSPVERPRPKSEPVKEEKKLPIPAPPLERKRSRQDLPALKTKEIPPQFRRSASAYAGTASLTDNGLPKATPKATRTPSEYMLSPDAITSGRGPKGYFDVVASPRYHPSSLHDNSGGWSATNGDKRNGAGVYSGASGPPSPSEKRCSGNFGPSSPSEKRSSGASKSRRTSNEKLTRPQQLSGEYSTRRHHRTPSAHSERPASPRSSGYFLRHYYSSDDDDELVDSSDSERRRRRHNHHHDHHHDHHKHSLRPDDDYTRHRRSNSSSRKSTLDSSKLQSKYTSPLPSPKVSPSQILRGDEKQRSEIFPTHESRRISSRPVSPNIPLAHSEDTPRASDRLNPLEPVPRMKSRQPSSSNVNLQPAAASQGSLPIVIPSRPSRIDPHSPGNSQRSPAIPQHEEPRSPSLRTPLEGKSYWQPPSFQPPSNSLAPEKPVGSYRRYSEDIERGSVAPLPTCPRTSFTRGHNDWLTLPQIEEFDICPSCYNSTMAKSEFRNHFVPSPLRSSDAEVICDFGSSPWYRIAWLLTLKERRRDLSLFYGLASIARSIQPCLGKHEAIRQWHSIVDPRTGLPIRNFDVCTSCVKSVETLLPAIRGIFVRVDSHPAGPPRVCDLRFDSKRFIKYFDVLEITANTAEKLGGLPDTREFAELAKRMSLIEECQHDTDLADRRWYMITQLPDFTVCDECYDEVIYPLEHEKRKAIPAMFTKSSQRIPKASCQLYSARMRDVFQKAVEADDYRYLASKARERKTVEVAYKANVADLKRRMVGILGGADVAVARQLSNVEEEWRKWE